jgi:hypothetical protein
MTKNMGMSSQQIFFQWFYLFLIRYMFRFFDHPEVGIHNRVKPRLAVSYFSQATPVFTLFCSRY